MKRIKPAHFFYMFLLFIILGACQAQPEAIKIPAATEENEPLELQKTDVQGELSAQEEAEPVIETRTPPSEGETDEGIAGSDPTPDLHLDPADWQNWPIIPEISTNGLAIYKEGISMGNDPTHFSKVGDCQNVVSFFLGDFDNGWYRLGDQYEDLQEVIDYYEGSWKNGMRDGKGVLTIKMHDRDSIMAGYWVENTYIGEVARPITYKVLEKDGIDRLTFFKVDDQGGTIEIFFTMLGNNLIPENLFFFMDTGNVSSIFTGYSDVDFPVKCYLTYQRTNQLGEGTIDCRLTFEIHDPGRWEVYIYH